MKDYLLQLLRNVPDPYHGRNLAREYLQARILESLQRSGAMIPLAFQGGTALRFLYNLPRFSEDLDFTLEQQAERYDFRNYLGTIQRMFQAEGYAIRVRMNDRNIIHSAFVSFDGLPYEIGLSPHRSEAFSVKVEVDTNPPSGAKLETSLVRRQITLRLQHHDRTSLFAGKLHAILQRKYAKGRDLYDLMWYLTEPSAPQPNLVLLQNALLQTGWEGPSVTSDNWRSLVYERLERMDWQAALEDVRPFLERPGEIDLLTLENFAQLLLRE